MREWWRRWYEANPEYNRERRRRWQEENPEAYAAIKARGQAKRRAKKFGVDHVSYDRRDIWARDGGVCQICGRGADPLDWHIDHIVPLIKGGSDSPPNVQVAHPVCNLRKGAAELEAQLRLAA